MSLCDVSSSSAAAHGSNNGFAKLNGYNKTKDGGDICAKSMEPLPGCSTGGGGPAGAHTAALVRKLKQELSAARRERDAYAGTNGQLRKLVEDWRYGMTRNRQHVQENIDYLCGEFKFYLREVKRTADVGLEELDGERRKVNEMLRKHEDLMTVLQEKLDKEESELGDLKDRLDAEIRRGDLLTRDLFLAESDLNNKLYLGTRATCAQCKARERVKNMMTEQVVEKAAENDGLRAQIDNLNGQVVQKEKIVNMLSKTNQQLSFDLKIKTHEMDTEVQFAIRKHEMKLRKEGKLVDASPIVGASATDPLGLNSVEPDAGELSTDGFFGNKSVHSTDGKCPHCKEDLSRPPKKAVDYSKFKIKKKGEPSSADESLDAANTSASDEPDNGGEAEDEDGTPVCALVRIKQPPAPPPDPEQQPHNSPPVINICTPPDTTPGSKRSASASQSPAPAKKGRLSSSAATPTTDDASTSADQDGTAVDIKLEKQPVDQPNFACLQENADWLWSQIEGLQNLVTWYRLELKATIDSRNFFADESETELGRVDELLEKLTDSLVLQQRQTGEIGVLERRCRDLQAVIDTRNRELEHVREQMSVLTRTVSAYLNGRQEHEQQGRRGY